MSFGGACVAVDAGLVARIRLADVREPRSLQSFGIVAVLEGVARVVVVCVWCESGRCAARPATNHLRCQLGRAQSRISARDAGRGLSTEARDVLVQAAEDGEAAVAPKAANLGGLASCIRVAEHELTEWYRWWLVLLGVCVQSIISGCELPSLKPKCSRPCISPESPAPRSLKTLSQAHSEMRFSS